MLSVLLCALAVLQGAYALTWKTPINNGSTIHRCFGHDVTFPWSYVTDKGENVMAVFWFSDKNGTIATLFAGHFMTSSNRVTYEPNAGITVSELTTDDVGTYGVHVRLYDDKRLETYVTNLVVVEPPTTTDGELRIEQQSHNASSTGNDACDPKVQLRCGQILTEGFPPVSVEWTGPEGEQLTTTDYQDGFFLLDLPPNHKGGNYTCSLVLDREVSRCLESDSLFKTSATLFVETMETKVAEQGESIELLKTEVEKFKNNARDLLSDDTARTLEEMKKSVSDLESTADNLTEQMDNDRAFAHRLYDMNLNRIKVLQNTSRDSLDRLERKMSQSLTEHARSLLNRLNTVSDKVTEQDKTASDHDKKIEDLQQQVEALQSSFDDEQKLSGELQKKVDTLLSDLTQQKTLSSDLQDKLLKLQTDADQQNAANSQQTDDIKSLKSRVEALLAALNTQAAVSTNLTKRLSELEGNLEAQKTITSEQESITSQFLPSLAEVQNGLAQQKTSLGNLETKLNNELNEQEKTLSGVTQDIADLQQKVDTVSSNTTSELTQLDDKLKSVQQDVTLFTDLHKVGRETLHDLLTNATDGFLKDLSVVLQRVSQLNDSVKSVMTSVKSSQSATSSQITLLQTSMAEVGRGYQSLLTRVQSVQDDLINVNEKLFPVRLVGGQNEREGRVEIRVGNTWGTICDDGWDENEAKVVCNMLGFFQSGAVPKSEAAFGQGTGPIVLDDLGCSGSEQDIRVCSSRAFGTHNCAHSEDAGVVCAG